MRRVTLTFLCAMAAACGGSNSSPTTPSTPPAPTVSGLAISGTDVLRTGFYTTFAATATLSNGTSQTVTPTWTSSATSVATVDSAGRVDARAHGQATLSATYQGTTATRTLRVMQNFGGSWSGVYRLRACDQSGVFRDVNWCGMIGGVGAQLPFTLNLSQRGLDASQIDGSISLGTLTGAVSGAVTGDGRLNIGGTFNVTSQGVTFSIGIAGWESRVGASDMMTGHWAQNMTAVGVAGNAYQECDIVSANHTSPEMTGPPRMLTPSVTAHWTDLFTMLTAR